MKILKFIGRVFLILIILLAGIYLIGKNVSNAYLRENYRSEIPPVIRPVKSLDSRYNYADSLGYLGRNKIIPEEYKDQILLALSHYPELVNVNIEFVIEPSIIPIASRPRPATIFHSKPNRWYCIVISNEGMGIENALLKNLSFNSQVGVIGHELGHTVYYKDQSSSKLVGLALAYLFKNFRARFEKDTDLRTVDHGLGWQLLEWAEELRGGIPNEFLDTYYLTPDEIRKAMEESGIY